MTILNHVNWTLRDGEAIECFEDEPKGGLWFAARVVPVPLPGTPVAPFRGEPNVSVEQCAIVAAHRNCLGEWQWLHLAPEAKEHIGNVMLDVAKVERDRWYYLVVSTDMEQAAEIARADRARQHPYTCIKCGVGEIADRKCDHCGFELPAATST